MWASHFVRNGNKLFISSWLASEVQVCRNVGRPNPRLPNLVYLSMTRIDNIFVSNLENLKSGILPIDVNDHMPIFYVYNFFLYESTQPEKIYDSNE